MAVFTILESGNTQVPLGGTAKADILATRNDVTEDVTTIQVVWKDHLGATLSDETWSGSDISDTATDGGAITLSDPSGTGTYAATYAPPNDGTYTPPAAGLTFTVTITVTYSDGATNGGETFEFVVIAANVQVALDTTTILSKVKRRTGILDDVLRVTETASKVKENGDGDDVIDLGKGPVYAIELAAKNGTAIVLGTDYYWNLYGSHVVLEDQAADGDHFFFKVQRMMPDAVINDFITESQRIILARLRGCGYSDPALVNYPTVQALICARTVGYIKEETSQGAALESPHYRSGNELIGEVNDILTGVCMGRVAILDDSGNEVARDDGSLVGGFRHPDGKIQGRLDVIDRAQQWTALFEHFYPEKPPIHVSSPRTGLGG